MLKRSSVSRAIVALLALTVLPRGELSAQAVSYFDGSFGASTWETVVVTPSTRQAVNFVVDGSTGNPFVRHDWSLPALPGAYTSDVVRVAYINRGFTYDPSVNGPLASLNVAFDYRFLNSTLPSGFGVALLRPVIRQGGVVYSVASSDVRVTSSNSQFTLAEYDFGAASDWISVGFGGRPDFSTSGSEIEFGYRFALGITCGAAAGCRAESSQTAVDNFSVTARPVSVASVPEPSMPLLLAPAVLALLFLRRRRGVQH
jgi:MYXO-CTERM domain-containing protein